MARTKQTARKSIGQLQHSKRINLVRGADRWTTTLRTRKSIWGHRKRRGRKVLQEIRKYQKTYHLLIPKITFQRIVRGIFYDFSNNDFIRIQPSAFTVIQEAAEAYLIKLFHDTNICAMHGKRQTIYPYDMRLVRYMRGEHDCVNLCFKPRKNEDNNNNSDTVIRINIPNTRRLSSSLSPLNSNNNNNNNNNTDNNTDNTDNTDNTNNTNNTNNTDNNDNNNNNGSNANNNNDNDTNNETNDTIDTIDTIDTMDNNTSNEN